MNALSFVLSLNATNLSERKATYWHTFDLTRAKIRAIFNVLTLLSKAFNNSNFSTSPQIWLASTPAYCLQIMPPCPSHMKVTSRDKSKKSTGRITLWITTLSILHHPIIRPKSSSLSEAKIWFINIRAGFNNQGQICAIIRIADSSVMIISEKSPKTTQISIFLSISSQIRCKMRHVSTFLTS